MHKKPGQLLFAVAVLGITIVAARFVSANASDSQKSPQSSPFDGKFVTVTTSDGLFVTLENTEFIALNGRPMLLGSEVVHDAGRFRSTGVKTYLAWESAVRCVVRSEGELGERVTLP